MLCISDAVLDFSSTFGDWTDLLSAPGCGFDFFEPDFSDYPAPPAEEYCSESKSTPAAFAAALSSLAFFFSSYLTSFCASLTNFSSCSLFSNKRTI
jgi:hypothetical protein